jgi:predicted enzyme related to lactoylglutathione lyase
MQRLVISREWGWPDRGRDMGEVERYPDGSFCWIDLGTTDVEGAKAFYGGLLGWEFGDLPAPEGSYTMCRLRGREVAGIHRHAEEEGTGWSSNVSVGDLDRATARARELGAEVLAEPFDVPGAGRTAVLRDPAGAVVSLWQAGGHAGAGLVNEVGSWNWNELVAPDLDRAKKFYGELFGWTAEDVPGPIPRTGFSLGELLVGAATPRARRSLRLPAGRCRSWWPTPTRRRPRPSGSAGGCYCRPWTSPSGASRSWPTRPGASSPPRTCPPAPSGASTAPSASPA